MHTWVFLDAAGERVGGSEAFADRAAAEAWMGESWEDLLEAGVEAVILEDAEGRAVYRMGLRAEPDGDRGPGD